MSVMFRLDDSLIAVQRMNLGEYVSLTHLACAVTGGAERLQRWLFNRKTIQAICLWEKENNPSFDEEGAEFLSPLISRTTFSLTDSRWRDITDGAAIIPVSTGKDTPPDIYAPLEIAFAWCRSVGKRFETLVRGAYQEFVKQERIKLFSRSRARQVVRQDKDRSRNIRYDANGYPSLSDIVSGTDGGRYLIDEWLNRPETLDFLITWESKHNKRYFDATVARRIKKKRPRWVTPLYWVITVRASGFCIVNQFDIYAENTIAQRFIRDVKPDCLLSCRWVGREKGR